MRRLTIGTFLRLQGPDGAGLFQGCAQFASEDTKIDLRVWDVSMWPTQGISRELGLDGAIAQIFPSMNTPASTKGQPIPVVNVSPCCASCPFPRIYPDEVGIGRAAAAFFLRRGYRHFLYCSNPDHGGDALRFEGFSVELGKSGFTSAIANLPGLPHEAYQLNVPRFEPAPRWLKDLPRPLAVMCFSDYEASFVVRTCEAARIRVPEEVAIMGVNNDYGWTHQTAVSISSFDPGFAKVGYAALADLARKLRKKTPLKSRTIRAFKIVPRRSTDALAVEDSLVRAAMDHIEECEGTRVDVPGLAKAVGVSRRVLERHFQKKAGFSILHAIQHARLEKAKTLVRSTDIALKDIATAAGFRDVGHMGKAFRATVGQTPTAYRS